MVEDSPKTVRDLMRVTGLGRDAVKAGIIRGELPGYKVGSRYVVPAIAFEAFCNGTWKADPKSLVINPVQSPMIHRREPVRP